MQQRNSGIVTVEGIVRSFRKGSATVFHRNSFSILNRMRHE